MIELRSYQELAIAQIDTEFKRGNKRVVLWASPGLRQNGNGNLDDGTCFKA